MKRTKLRIMMALSDAQQSAPAAGGKAASAGPCKKEEQAANGTRTGTHVCVAVQGSLVVTNHENITRLFGERGGLRSPAAGRYVQGAGQGTHARMAKAPARQRAILL
jgi:hypothetical protein